MLQPTTPTAVRLRPKGEDVKLPCSKPQGIARRLGSGSAEEKNGEEDRASVSVSLAYD